MYSLGLNASKLVSLSNRPSIVAENKCQSSTAEMSPKFTLQNLKKEKKGKEKERKEREGKGRKEIRKEERKRKMGENKEGMSSGSQNLKIYVLWKKFPVDCSVLQNNTSDLFHGLVEEFKRWSLRVQSWVPRIVLPHVALNDEIKRVFETFLKKKNG